MEKLTGKQRRFADEYLVCLNGTEAHRRAGYSGDDNVHAVEASRLLRNPKILAYVDEQLKQYAMPANEVLVQLTDIARGDIADALNAAGGIDPLEAKKRGKSHLIKRLKTKITTITEKDGTEREIVEDEIEFYDRQSALNTLAKYHNLTTNQQLTVLTWEDRAVQDIKDGKLSYQDLADAFDSDLATALFTRAGVPVSSR